MTLVVSGFGHPQIPLTHGADVIRLVSVDFEDPAITVIAVPPNLWVETNELNGVPQAILRRIYWYAKSQAKISKVFVDHIAAMNMARALYDNFDFYPDHYLIIEQSPHNESVNAIGGISLDLVPRIDGGAAGFDDFPPGEQTLDGSCTLV